MNNQKGHCEIARALDGATIVLETIGYELIEAQIEMVYKSFQYIPTNVKPACGYQTGRLLNSGFADQMLPPYMGKAERLLIPENDLQSPKKESRG